MTRKLTDEEKAERRKERAGEREEEREAKKIAREKAEIEAEKNQKPVRKIIIIIEWKRSRMYGNNPHATADVSFHDGTFEHATGFTCSGCGYDKESTVIAQVFNRFLKYKLWEKSNEEIKGGHGSGDNGPAPYGVRRSNYGRGYSEGIGTYCYAEISKYIGGGFFCIASGKTFDVYEYRDNEESKDGKKRKQGGGVIIMQNDKKTKSKVRQAASKFFQDKKDFHLTHEVGQWWVNFPDGSAYSVREVEGPGVDEAFGAVDGLKFELVVEGGMEFEHDLDPEDIKEADVTLTHTQDPIIPYQDNEEFKDYEIEQEEKEVNGRE